MSDGSLVFFSLLRGSVGYGTYVVKDYNQPLCFMNPVEETVTECIKVLECCSNEMIFQLLRNESAIKRVLVAKKPLVSILLFPAGIAVSLSFQKKDPGSLAKNLDSTPPKSALNCRIPGLIHTEFGTQGSSVSQNRTI